jgi:poly-gamma-glutamate synthesis protein (capsule biosynthesis protein)
MNKNMKNTIVQIKERWALIMAEIERRKRPLLLFAVFVFLACGPQMVYQPPEELLRSDAPIFENEENSFALGFKNSRYIKRIWPEKKPALITAMGDVVLNYAVKQSIIDYRIKKYGREDAMRYPFSRVNHEIKGVAFCNLEAPITSHPLKVFNDKDEIFYFKSPPGSEEMLEYAGINIASLANNHIIDAGIEGMYDTAERIKKSGVTPVGIGDNISQALEPVYVWHRGTRVAFFAFNRVVPKGVWAGADRPGAAGGSDEILCAAVKRVRDQVDAVVVSIHWGQEMTYDIPVAEPEYEQVTFGRKLIDSGASLILGHQTHAAGRVERYKNGIIFYSLGDFVFAGRHSASHKTSMMVQVELSEKGVESYSIIPVNINPLDIRYRVEILKPDKGLHVINRVLPDRDNKYRHYYTHSEVAKN